jgi:Holliday junction DNA helicase RuvA
VIASLRGKVLTKTNSSVVLDVSGVGYLVSVPSMVSAQARVGEEFSVWTTLVVREDSFQLFGFESAEQQGLFDLLRSVSGVGPKTALNIISTLTSAEISLAVTTDNSKPFESVSGVGAKTAKLINVTLSGKLKGISSSADGREEDLLSALQSLGWNEKTALPVVQAVCKKSDSKDMSSLIRECLALLSK